MSGLCLARRVLLLIGVTCFIVSLALLLFSFGALSASPIEWQRLNGGEGTDWFRSVKRTPDGGFICAGAYDYHDSDTELTRGYVVRTTSTGTLVWEKRFGIQKKTVFESVIVSEDGFVACGYTNSKGAGGFDVYVVRLDSEGNLIFEKTFGGAGDEKGYAIAPVPGGGWVVAAEVTVNVQRKDIDAGLLRVGADGGLLWQKAYGSDVGREGTQSGYSVDVLSDGFIVAGLTSERVNEYVRAYCIRTDASGARLWEADFGGAGNAWVSAVRASSSGFFLSGVNASKGYLWALRADGSLDYEHAYQDGMFHSVDILSDGSLATVGYRSIAQTGSINAYAARIDAGNGQLTWELDFGGTGTLSSAYESQENLDGSIVVAGVTNSAGLGAKGQDAYLVKMLFTVPPAPSLSLVTPARGAPGDAVTLYGEYFGTYVPGYSWVSFSGVKATKYVTWEPTRIIARVPYRNAGACEVSVSTPWGTSNSLTFEVLLPRPVIQSLYPTKGLSGSVLTVSGLYFGSYQAGKCYVSFGSKKIVDFLTWTDKKIALKVPKVAPGKHLVSVTNANGTSNAAYFSVQSPAPYIRAISPQKGAPGALARLEGEKFGSFLSGKTWVSFGGLKITNVKEWGPTVISFLVPVVDDGRYPVSVTTPDGKSNSVFFTVSVSSLPEGSLGPIWYLAEGSSAWGFETYVTMLNPNERDVRAAVKFMLTDGSERSVECVLPAESQTVINPRNYLGAMDFSTRVESVGGEPICVDRRMIWQGSGAACSEGHASIGVTKPSGVWYFAEGSSAWGFESWILVLNPSGKKASVQFKYMLEGGGLLVFQKEVAPRSRASFNMADDVGARDASVTLMSDVPVVAERSMYRYSRREGHCSTGVTAPSGEFYIAEGSVGWGFTTYVLIENPADEACQVSVDFLTSAGEVRLPTFEMPARSRKTINVNESVALPHPDFSTRIRSTGKIVAERSMYWGSWAGEACHCSVGFAQPRRAFYFPDGETSNGHETWTLVQNPNDVPVRVRVSYLPVGGEGKKIFEDEVPARSRKTYSMGGVIESGRAGIVVECLTQGKAIFAERSMYWNNRAAGTSTLGSPS